MKKHYFNIFLNKKYFKKTNVTILSNTPLGIGEGYKSPE